ncbi:MAG: FtsX-like permease family protein [Chitinophagales bacterium]|nr:FtsX-like permease family protein [Chitinophagales bacterium]
MLRTALRFIYFDKPKSIGALAGTIISVFLIGQQVGIFIFLINAMSALVRNNAEYVWVVDNKTTNVNALAELDMRINYELRSLPNVAATYPLVVSAGSARFENGKSAGVTLVGVEAPAFAGGPWNVAIGNKNDLLQDGAVFTEYFDKPLFGGLQPGQYFEINGKKVFNAGETKGIRVFGGGVFTFTTIERARYLGNVPTTKANAFLIKMKDPAQRDQLIAAINGTIPSVRAWRSEDLTKETIMTILATSGIAISFGTLIFFALIVGFVIIGLTLYSSAIDRIKDYGTLKAIGATNGYITRLIVTQAMVIAITGFCIGMVFVEGFRNGIANAGTIFNYPLWLRFAFFGVTILIGLFGSLFAVRRITSLEPAAVFRG